MQRVTGWRKGGEPGMPAWLTQSRRRLPHLLAHVGQRADDLQVQPQALSLQGNTRMIFIRTTSGQHTDDLQVQPQALSLQGNTRA